MINANELKRKMVIEVEGQPWLVLEVFFASPTARGASTMVRAKVRNLLTGNVLEKNFKTSEKFQESDVEKTKASFLYADTDSYHFMDETSFEQFSFTAAKIGDMKFYLKEGVALEALRYNGHVISFDLPPYVELKVITAAPGMKGDSAGSGTKQATLETGLEVRVPQYIQEGDVVRVNPETGEVAGRA